MNRLEKKSSLYYLLFTFIISWTLVFLYQGITGTPKLPFWLPIVYMFVPMISVFIVRKSIVKTAIKKPLGISFTFNRWFFAAWLLPLIFAFSTLGVSLLFPVVEFSPDMSGFYERMSEMLSQEQIEQMKSQAELLPIPVFWISVIQGLIAGITINAVAGFGEELGWRGLLFDDWKSMNFWKISLLTGTIWGIWHAPIILQGHNYPQHPVIGVFIMTLWCIFLAPAFTLIRWKSGSVIAASILHGSLNAVSGLALIPIKGGSDLLVGVTGLAGFIVLAVANVIIFVYLGTGQKIQLNTQQLQNDKEE